jgi:hypothetical protein
MPTYEIWSEGYRTSGDEPGYAYHHWTMDGDTFADACVAYAAQDPEFAKYFHEARLTYWGCRLFATEAEARKTFG